MTIKRPRKIRLAPSPVISPPLTAQGIAQARAQEAEAVASEAVRASQSGASLSPGPVITPITPSPYPSAGNRAELAEVLADQAVRQTEQLIEKAVLASEAIATRAVAAAADGQERAIEAAQLRASEAVAATERLILRPII